MTDDEADATLYQFTPAPPGSQVPPAPSTSNPKRGGGSRRSRATKAAAGLVLVLGAGASSAAAAMATSSGHPAGLASATAKTPTPAPARKGPRALPWAFHRALGPAGLPGLAREGLGAVVHGSFTVRGPNGSYETLDTQIGTVEQVSTGSITIKSADGFTQSYSVNSSTVVYAEEQGISSIATGDQVAVLGLASSSGVTAERVVDLTQLQTNRRSWGPLPPATPIPTSGAKAANLDAGAIAPPPEGPPDPAPPAA